MSFTSWISCNYLITREAKVISFKGKEPKELKQVKDTKGYVFVTICENGVHKQERVHRLMAKAFITNPLNKTCVNHKNSIRDDNTLSNLEWVTYSENNIHGYRQGRVTHLKTHKIRSREVECISTGEVFNSAKEASLHYGLNEGAVSRACSGRTKLTKGLEWRYLNG